MLLTVSIRRHENKTTASNEKFKTGVSNPVLEDIPDLKGFHPLTAALDRPTAKATLSICSVQRLLKKTAPTRTISTLELTLSGVYNKLLAVFEL